MLPPSQIPFRSLPTSSLFIPLSFSPPGSWSERGNAPSSGETWRSSRSAACRCSPRPPGTSVTSRSGAREGTRRAPRPRRRPTPTSPSPNPAGPPLEPGKAPPRGLRNTGVRGDREKMWSWWCLVMGDRERYKTNPLFFYLASSSAQTQWSKVKKKKRKSDVPFSGQSCVKLVHFLLYTHYVADQKMNIVQKCRPSFQSNGWFIQLQVGA